MKIGLIPNTTKMNTIDILNDFLLLLEQFGIEYLFSDNLLELKDQLVFRNTDTKFMSIKKLGESADIIVSFGGDGTMLHNAYELRGTKAPMLGLNLGKLGFLAEYEMKDVPQLVNELKENKFVIDERMALSAFNKNEPQNELYAINDLVIDKGRWQKMIELTVKVDDHYVSTFSADGIIIATPTGSTGYSLSTGGPIVNPKADAITISPISPHTLTMRPLVLSSNQKIEISVRSPYESVQVNCDGQRVYYYQSPVTLEINKSSQPVKLIHSNSSNYFEILRNKLFWGLDLRTNIS
ncbi:MAG: NAD(+)/NADH kinase [Melioribacteraceae bacterium]|nr:NAD(+)/NADH kinase [Melioribacteraceae bacterium]RJP60760.1 MAG: NAD(+)/NADH kinase [Ignavibacteriales bacterium]WKZ68618.1 MAG: NAD(+)/NADH kinase [Melioribacteraceae bacterium]